MHSKEETEVFEDNNSEDDFSKKTGGVKLETKINIFKKWTERFTDMHPTKPHPAPGGTCQDTWQRLSKKLGL